MSYVLEKFFSAQIENKVILLYKLFKTRNDQNLWKSSVTLSTVEITSAGRVSSETLEDISISLRSKSWKKKKKLNWRKSLIRQPFK